MSSNATMLWPVWNDLEFVSHAILPHKTEDHYITLIKFFYDKSFNYSAVVLKYSSNPKSFNFQTLTEVSMSEYDYLIKLLKEEVQKIDKGGGYC